MFFFNFLIFQFFNPLDFIFIILIIIYFILNNYEVVYFFNFILLQLFT
jgi:hypothetical protein